MKTYDRLIEELRSIKYKILILGYEWFFIARVSELISLNFSLKYSI